MPPKRCRHASLEVPCQTLKGRLPKSPGKIGSEALERPNYVVLRLQGKENMAVMFAQSVFKAIPESCAFEMSADAWDGSGQVNGSWTSRCSLPFLDGADGGVPQPHQRRPIPRAVS